MTVAPTCLVCAGCGAEIPAEAGITWACPAAVADDDIDHVLKRAGGNQSQAAQLLQIDRKTLRSKLYI